MTERVVACVSCCGEGMAIPIGEVTLVLYRHPPQESYYEFFCRIGQHRERRRATAEAITLLRSAGVVPTLVEMGEPGDPPITSDDLLDFSRALLGTDRLAPIAGIRKTT